MLTIDRQGSVFAAMFLCSVMVSGCAAPVILLGAGAGAGAGTVAYMRGEWVQSYPESFDRVWKAAQEAVADLHITLAEKRETADGGTIEGSRADGKSVVVRVSGLPGGLSEVRIRIGWFGDRDISSTISNEIALRLKTSSS